MCSGALYAVAPMAVHQVSSEGVSSRTEYFAKLLPNTCQGFLLPLFVNVSAMAYSRVVQGVRCLGPRVGEGGDHSS